MEKTYDELLLYNIWDAITLKASQDKLNNNRNNEKNPCTIMNNPLLTDYDWVYDHVESILVSNSINYCYFQGFKEYYFLFKVVTEKYLIDDDYDEIIFNHMDGNKYKWYSFAIHMIDFFAKTSDPILVKLFKQDDFLNYFSNHSKIFDNRLIENFRNIGIRKLLKCNIYANYYLKNPASIISLIRNHPNLDVPTELLMNEKVIKGIAENCNVEKFYFDLQFISEIINPTPYIEYHRIYCDNQIRKIENFILPCLIEEYKKSSDIVSKNNFKYCSNYLKDSVAIRIFNRHNTKSLDKKVFYKELSKYMIIGMFISRNYETFPYNLLIDIETLYKFSKENNKSLIGNEIYEFLLTYEEKDIVEIIEKYLEFSKLPLMEILYDDWKKLEEEFIDEINENLLDLDKLSVKQTEDGTNYYDITDVKTPILVHNTSIPLKSNQQILELLDEIENGEKNFICLSLQDQVHQYYYKNDHVGTLILAFGKIDKKRVGIVCHEDAYSLNPTVVESDNYQYKRRLYTLKDFMNSTIKYNEIVYVIRGEPFYPIGIICDDEIKKEQINAASILNVPILFRKREEKVPQESYCNEKILKHYTYTIETSRYLF